MLCGLNRHEMYNKHDRLNGVVRATAFCAIERFALRTHGASDHKDAWRLPQLQREVRGMLGRKA
jgi:hypothetical protein